MSEKYAVLCATGNIGSGLTEILLKKGAKVRAIARSKEKLKSLEEKGAEIFAGNIAESQFLTDALRGMDAVFLMIPPDYAADDFRKYSAKIGDSIFTALKNSGVKYAVNLSSTGAHLREGSGIVLGLHDQEEKLNRLEGINIIHIRAAYFMENLFQQIGMIKNQNMTGSPVRGDLKIPMIATKDISQKAAELMVSRKFTGKSHIDIFGDQQCYNDVTAILAKSAGKEGVNYVQFPYDAAKNAMTGMGMSPSAAGALADLAKGINEGLVYSDFKKDKENTTPTRLSDFAAIWTSLYNKS